MRGPDLNSIVESSSGETFWRRVFEAPNKREGPIRTDYPQRRDRVHWEYLRHCDIQNHDGYRAGGGRTCDDVEILPAKCVSIRQAPSWESGLSTTLFRRGFQRRRQIHIRQDEPRLEREAYKIQMSSAYLKRRRERLERLDKRNGFNVITGKFDPTNRRCTTPFHIQPSTTREAGLLSEVDKRKEYILLRDSQFKFHAPAWSGKNHDSRQDLLLREGLNKAKKSSLLGIGTDDLASSGVEDMFSKAVYDPAKSCAVEGLLESSIPGRYTPRKMVHSPATLGRSRNSSLARTIAGNWPFSSSAELGTVFRVLPSGLNGHSHVLLPRTGASVPGIAPPKRPSTSKSAPVLSQQTPMSSILRSRVIHAPHNGIEGNNGGDSDRSTIKGEPGHTKGLFEISPDSELLGRAYEGDHGTLGQSRRSRRSSRSSLDHKSSSTSIRSLQKSISESVSVLQTGSFSGSSKVSTPAQRREADQLALDLATVRSLDA